MAKNIDCTTFRNLKLTEINNSKIENQLFYESLKKNSKIEELYKLALQAYIGKVMFLTYSVFYKFLLLIISLASLL